MATEELVMVKLDFTRFEFEIIFIDILYCSSLLFHSTLELNDKGSQWGVIEATKVNTKITLSNKLQAWELRINEQQKLFITN